MRNRCSISRGMIGFLLSCALLPTVCSRPPQSRNETAVGSGAQTKGTGVVPPVVRLADAMPAAAPAKSYLFPKAAVQKLANGVSTFVVSDNEQPMVTVRLVLTGAGSVNDPGGKPGVAKVPPLSTVGGPTVTFVRGLV